MHSYDLLVIFHLSPFEASHGLFLFHPALFALGDKPTLPADSAQDTTLDNLLAKALQELILRLIIA